MDAARFTTELPGLFDDFPRSPLPRGPRYDDVIDGIPNLATENVLALLNLAASLLGPGESYVEVGSFYGASLIGAARGNPGEFIGIDRFSFDARGALCFTDLAPGAGTRYELARFDVRGHLLGARALELIVQPVALGDALGELGRELLMLTLDRRDRCR